MEMNVKKDLPPKTALVAAFPITDFNTVRGLNKKQSAVSPPQQGNARNNDFAERLAKVAGELEKTEPFAENAEKPRNASRIGAEMLPWLGTDLFSLSVPDLVPEESNKTGLSVEIASAFVEKGLQTSDDQMGGRANLIASEFMLGLERQMTPSQSASVAKTGLALGSSLLQPTQVLPEHTLMATKLVSESLNEASPVLKDPTIPLTRESPLFREVLLGPNPSQENATLAEETAAQAKIDGVKIPGANVDFRVLSHQTQANRPDREIVLNQSAAVEKRTEPLVVSTQPAMPTTVKAVPQNVEPGKENLSRFPEEKPIEPIIAADLSETDFKEFAGESMERNPAHGKAGVKEHANASPVPFEISRQEVVTTPPVVNSPERPRTDLHDVVRQITENLVSPAQNLKSSQMVVALKPQHLGEVTIRVQVDGDKVTAAFHAASAEVRAILESSLPQLRQEMSQQGWQFDSNGIFGGMQEFLANQQQRQPGWQGFVPVRHSGGAEYEDAIAFNRTGHLQILSSSAVDYRV